MVTCHSSSGSCPLKVKSGSCYCCELYRCQSTEHPPIYYEFVGVCSCRDVLHLYRLLWASSVLNVLGALLGVLTAAVLGAFKDMHAQPLPEAGRGLQRAPGTLQPPQAPRMSVGSQCLPSAMGIRSWPFSGAESAVKLPERSTRSPYPSWLTARLLHLRPSTTLPSRSWPTQASAGRLRPSSPARPTLCLSRLLCSMWCWCVVLSRPGAFSDPRLGPAEVRLGGLARSLGPVSCSSGVTAELALSHALPTAAATS
ncbi:transmembrane protein 255B isoform X1 [Lutra lutra]|uniref:transmembrane protein 255B isoform X1 n=1 Tax=Lutra lutra TaxID=9657 RepID=UPI001FD51313|nr:transmembrane protein 255B isoform X1 [Lutra lutra]